MTTNKGGKPQKTLTPEQVLEVGTLSAFLSQEQIADYFGIARNTFIAICERQPEVFEQYKKGKARAIGTVAKGLIKQAMDGNTSAAMFYLKTQAGWSERSAETENTTPPPAKVIIRTYDGRKPGVN